MRKWIVLCTVLVALSACTTSKTQPAATDTQDQDVATDAVNTDTLSLPLAEPALDTALTPEPIPAQPTATPSEQALQTDPAVRTYTHDFLRFAFDYPTTWSVSDFVVPRGSVHQENNRMDVTANDYDIWVFSVVQGENELRLEAPAEYNTNMPPTCGGEGPFTNRNDFVWRTVFDRQFFRTAIENRIMPSLFARPDPQFVSVHFTRLRQEEMTTWPQTDTDDNFVGLFCLRHPDTASILFSNITYYSSNFTTANIENGTVDSSILSAMDSILASLRNTVLP